MSSVFVTLIDVLQHFHVLEEWQLFTPKISNWTTQNLVMTCESFFVSLRSLFPRAIVMSVIMLSAVMLNVIMLVYLGFMGDIHNSCHISIGEVYWQSCQQYRAMIIPPPTYLDFICLCNTMEENQP